MDIVPTHLMTPERVAWAQSVGLAQRLPVTNPEPADAPPGPAVPAGRTEQKLALVGLPITGREALVLQVPGGQVRYEGDLTRAAARARELALSENAMFAVFQPLRVVAPQTIIQEEMVDPSPGTGSSPAIPRWNVRTGAT